MRKGLVVFGIIFFSIVLLQPSYGQSWRELLDRADSLSAAANYDSAIIIGELALEEAEKEFGKQDTVVARILHQFGKYCYGQGDYSKAELMNTRSLSIREKAFGENHPEVAKSLYNLAIAYSNQGEYSKAEPLLLRTISILKGFPDSDPSVMAKALNGLANVYNFQGKYTEAEPLYKQSLSILEEVYGEDHRDVGGALGNMGYLYMTQGKYAEAEQLFRRSLFIMENSHGSDQLSVAGALYAMALLHSKYGRIEESASFLKRSLTILDNLEKTDSSLMAAILNLMANNSQAIGKYAEAESILMRSLNLTKNIHGTTHSSVATELSNLANSYTLQGKYANAELTYERALEIINNNHGSGHPLEANCLGNMAILYVLEGRITDAEKLQKRVIVMKNNIYGDEHIEVSNSLSNLANLYTVLGNYSGALSMHTQSLQMRKKILGANHLSVAVTMYNVAICYFAQGNYVDADRILMDALGVMECAVNHQHPEVANLYTIIGLVRYEQGRYEDAMSAFNEAIIIGQKTLGRRHIRIGVMLIHSSRVYRILGDHGEAIELAKDAYNIVRMEFIDNWFVLSEKDAVTYSQHLRSASNWYLTFLLGHGDIDKSDVENAVNALIATKGIVSDGLYDRQKVVVKETDSTTLALAEKLRLNKFLRANLFVQGPGEDLDEYRNKVDSLDKLVNDLESELSRHSASYRKYQDQKDVSVDRIASLLPDGSALVEYLKYDYYQLKPDSTIPRYLAVVLTSKGEPAIINLGDASEIDPLIENYRDHMLKVSNRIPGPTDSDLKEYREIGKKIYSKIWQPIEEHIDNRKLVFIAPDGVLNMISFAGLINDDGTYLIEEHPIHYLSAGRDLIRLADESNPGSGLLAIGDPDFDSTTSMTTRQAFAPEDTASDISILANLTRNHRSRCAAFDELDLPRLAGTRTEVETVIAEWRRSIDEPVIGYFDDEATEDRFKEEAPGKRAIHLATHGFYYEGVCRPDLPQRRIDSDVGYVGENPLLLSGLFFAGANRNRDSLVNNSGEDGILTAYEVSAMNLEGTELVVLSACETGLGEVKDGEGVYGLRRAFQMAGARTVVSALWPVSDQATSELLGKLYDEQGPSMPDRFRKIQLEKLSKLRDQNMVDHPISWAGFIALGNWK